MGHLCPIKTLDFARDDCANPFARRSPGEIEQVLFPAWKGSVSIENNDHNSVLLERKTPCVRCPAQEVHKESARGQGRRKAIAGRTRRQGKCKRLKGERGGKAGAGDCRASAGRTWGEENARGRKGSGRTQEEGKGRAGRTQGEEGKAKAKGGQGERGRTWEKAERTRSERKAPRVRRPKGRGAGRLCARW